MGGIWMWSLYGAGIGSVYVYRRYPDLLSSQEALMAKQTQAYEAQPNLSRAF